MATEIQIELETNVASFAESSSRKFSQLFFQTTMMEDYENRPRGPREAPYTVEISIFE